MGRDLSHGAGWRWIAASLRGTSHLGADLPCQDAWQARDVASDTIILVAADGAGSASRADAGSRAVCDLLVEHVARVVSFCDQVPDLGVADALVWLEDLREALARRAREEDAQLRDYASTLLLAVVGVEGGVFAQIGDGVIVIRDEREIRPVFWPDAGEYVNTTYFVTDEKAADHLRFCAVKAPIWDVAVVTDGLQSLCLSFAEQAVHAPFFQPMFDRLEKEPPGRAEDLCAQLQVFLGSDAVNARTDDDKTLLLASRPRAAGTGEIAPGCGDGQDAV